MDVWYYRISVACHTMEFEFILLSPVGVVHSTWPSWAMWHVHAPRFNKWHKKKTKKKKKNKKVTLHILTHGALWWCGLTSLMVCINDRICDIRERNMTIRSEIWTTNISSLGFRYIREWVRLWRLILLTLGCIGLCEYKLALCIDHHRDKQPKI